MGLYIIMYSSFIFIAFRPNNSPYCYIVALGSYLVPSLLWRKVYFPNNSPGPLLRKSWYKVGLQLLRGWVGDIWFTYYWVVKKWLSPGCRCNFTAKSIRQLKVAYNRIFRILICLEHRTSICLPILLKDI